MTPELLLLQRRAVARARPWLDDAGVAYRPQLFLGDLKKYVPLAIQSDVGWHPN